MVTDVERRLGRDDQKVFGAIDHPTVAEEARLAEPADFLELSHRAPKLPCQLAQAIEVHVSHRAPPGGSDAQRVESRSMRPTSGPETRRASPHRVPRARDRSCRDT